MVKRLQNFVLPLLGLTLSVMAMYLWYSAQNQSNLPITAEQNGNLDGAIWQEPIIPIPLEIELDARKVALGKRLFNDPTLSHDNTVSCSTCHDLSKGGADGLSYPVGIGNQIGQINTLTVFNSGFNFKLFWDGRAATLEDQMDFPLQHAAEMATSWPVVIAKLLKDSTYRKEFLEIYPEHIQPATVKDAIATFERSLITPNARFDRYLRGDKQAITPDELAGYELFKSLGCISCHQGMNVGGNMYEKLGIVNDYFAHRGHVREADFGRYNVTGIEEHRYEFRVPSLRNVELTAPYLHDASASTLSEAVAIMAKYQLGVELSADELGKIVKFLRTLTGIYSGNSAK